MKRVKKLAEESAKNHVCPDSYVCEWEDAFEAGFREAQRLAIEAFQGQAPHVYEKIRNLADEEV